MISIVALFFVLVGWPLPSRAHVRLPFHRSDLACDAYDPVVVWLTEKEVRRCVEAIDWYIETNGEEMTRRGLDSEIARYEDLMYRFMGVPDKNMKDHAEARDEDRYGRPLGG